MSAEQRLHEVVVAREDMLGLGIVTHPVRRAEGKDLHTQLVHITTTLMGGGDFCLVLFGDHGEGAVVAIAEKTLGHGILLVNIVPQSFFGAVDVEERNIV